MNEPIMLMPQTVTDDIRMLGAWLPVPGFGVLPVNAFVIRSGQPVLVDTGLAALGEAFLEALSEVIEPAQLRWIWLTHTDPDHVGNLAAVLALAPRARVVTNYLGMGKLGLLGLPPERVRLLNPGDFLDVGGHQLQAVTPPCYDAPETMAIYDRASRILFSADCFGALLEAPADQADEIPEARLREQMRLWSSVDAPWLHLVAEDAFAQQLETMRQLEVDWVLGSHLPPAWRMFEQLIAYLDEARSAPVFVGPDQAALQALMAQPAG